MITVTVRQYLANAMEPHSPAMRMSAKLKLHCAICVARPARQEVKETYCALGTPSVTNASVTLFSTSDGWKDHSVSPLLNFDKYDRVWHARQQPNARRGFNGSAHLQPAPLSVFPCLQMAVKTPFLIKEENPVGALHLAVSGVAFHHVQSFAL